MRLLILFISFLISQIAEGQIINASPPYRVRATGGCSYLLDTYSGAAAAYSLRKLDVDYAGSAIRVRRSSDNTEQDIGFTGACGDLDTASLKTFVGTGGTDDGFIVTWYDQSGNSRDATQATAGNQPKIMDNGVVLRRGTNPTLTFDGSDDFLGRVDTGMPTGDASFTTVSYCASASYSVGQYGNLLTYGATSTGSSVMIMYGDDGSMGSDALGVSNYGDASGIASRLQQYNLQFAYKPSTTGTWYNYVNNSLSSSKSLTTNTTLSGGANSLLIGKVNFAATYINGDIQEVIAWGSDLRTSRTSIETSVNSYYTVY